MIVSASRRTDIPAFYSDWFYEQLRKGCVLVRNPFNFNQVREISLSPQNIDCFVFWTKNPGPMLDRLQELAGFPYYFLFTLNAYGSDLEKYLPPKNSLLKTFVRLSERIGKQRVIWRYDPILLTAEYDLNYHLRNFSALVHALSGYTDKCIFSFFQPYPKVLKRIGTTIKEPADWEKYEMIKFMVDESGKNKIKLASCAQDFQEFGVEPAGCIDAGLISCLSGKILAVKKDRNQRKDCGCAASVDIGAYNSCRHGCVYCYASNSSI
jgi:hypothetical protein